MVCLALPVRNVTSAPIGICFCAGRHLLPLVVVVCCCDDCSSACGPPSAMPASKHTVHPARVACQLLLPGSNRLNVTALSHAGPGAEAATHQPHGMLHVLQVKPLFDQGLLVLAPPAVHIQLLLDQEELPQQGAELSFGATDTSTVLPSQSRSGQVSLRARDTVAAAAQVS